MQAIKIKLFILAFSFIFTNKALASIRIAFLEYPIANGQSLQLEDNGRYFHIAIKYRDKWLHAHPYRGVELIEFSKLKSLGRISSILVIKNLRSLKEQDVIKYLGKDYDSEFSWSDEKIYCSELIAKLLNIPPQEMSFLSPAWPVHYHRYNGQLGISPDDIYRLITKNKGDYKFEYLQCKNKFKS